MRPLLDFSTIAQALRSHFAMIPSPRGRSRTPCAVVRHLPLDRAIPNNGAAFVRSSGTQTGPSARILIIASTIQLSAQ